jgi:hypothetical protein
LPIVRRVMAGNAGLTTVLGSFRIEEEDTCHCIEEEDTCHCIEEEDTCHCIEEEDTCHLGSFQNSRSQTP